MKPRKTRQHKGIQPEATSARPGPHYLLGTLTRHAVTWELWELIGDETAPDWINCKLIALPKRPGKANYFFGWCVSESRFGRVRDADLLLEHEPKVYAWVLATLDPETFGAMI